MLPGDGVGVFDRLRAAATLMTFAAIAFVTIFSTIVAFACWTRGVELIGPNRAGVFLHLVPIFSALLTGALLGESLMGYHVVGFALILAGVLVRGARVRGMDRMSARINAIDCDVHPTVTGNEILLPYLETYWRDMVEERGMGSLESASYPPDAPITRTAGLRGADGYAATDAGALGAQVLDHWGASHAILNCLYGVQLIFNEDMARAFASALNDWIAKEWLDRDPRLRASIVVPTQNVEIRGRRDRALRARISASCRFWCWSMQETPLGRRHHWPIFAAAERHGLPIGIHAGSNYRNPVTSLGWPTYTSRITPAQPQGFQSPGGEPDHRGRVREISRSSRWC